MKRLLLPLIVIGPVAVLAIGVVVMRGGAAAPPQPIAAGALSGANVLLVTIDTLRADHVGVYGSEGTLTPTIDQFAREGLRFERTYAHVPLTLASHASLLTASYPTRNGVHDNWTFRLGESSPTVADTLKRAGYRTAAFVGAFVLDARFGLGRGFDVYDDRMSNSGSEPQLAQRNAGQVLEPAYDWIVGRGSGTGEQGSGIRDQRSGNSSGQHQAPGTVAPDGHPWFAWVHLNDPHEPYAPPEPYRSRYASEPYDGEIAYTDAALGTFVAELRRADALTNTLVIVASDHGESLGEHGERTHGLFAYDATLRVPLVIWAPPRLRPGIFAETMRLVDVVPTMLDLLGMAPLANVDGRSVRPFVGSGQPFDRVASYFEALNANLTRGWAPLTGLVRDRVKLIDLPIPEWYDLASDPGEQRNLYVQQRDRARDLETRLSGIANAALGRLVAPAANLSRTYTAADDPKNLVHVEQR